MSDLNNWNVAAESGYQYTTDPPDGFPEGKLPSVVNNVIREVMAAIKRRYADANGSIVSTGTGGAYAVTANETVSALYDGLRVSFRANHTNTGASTLDWDGTGVTTMKKNNGGDTNAGDIPANAIVDCVYNDTNSWWQVINARESTANVQIDMFSGTGAQTVFVLSADPVVKKNVSVYIDGVYQQNATYNVSGTTLTFTEAPPSGTNNIEVRITSPVPAAVVDDDSVTLAKMAPGTPGGMIGYDASGNPFDLGEGEAGQVPVSQGAAAPAWGVGVPTAVGVISDAPPSFSYSGTTDLVFEAKDCTADNAAKTVMTANGITKSISTTFTAGDGNGCLDTGTIAPNTWYAVFAIAESTASVVEDYLISLFPTAPTMPGGYALKRRIGWMLTNGTSQVTPFEQNPYESDRFYLSTPVQDLAGNYSTTGALATLTVPPLSRPIGTLTFLGSTDNSVSVTSPDYQSPSSVPTTITGNNYRNSVDLSAYTVNSSSQIYIKAIGSGVVFTSSGVNGWIDRRGRDG